MELPGQPPALGLAEARGLLRRAVDKAESFGQAGAFVTVDPSGAPVSGSRMDGAGGSGFGICRAKAYVSAVNREPSDIFAQRMTAFFPGIYAAYEHILRDRVFPGGGGVPVRQDGMVVGAISTGGSIGPRVKLPGVAPHRLLVDGKPANLEDIIISYALGAAYSPQHGDDLKRWVEAYGAPPDGAEPGSGLAAAPPASRQPVLAHALRLADAVIAEARRRRAAVSLVITDRLGDTVQLDRMDGAPPMGPDLATALAVTAVNFARPTAELNEAYGSAEIAQIAGIVPYTLFSAPGGLPILVDGEVRGALGVSGASTRLCHDIAETVLMTFTTGGEPQ
jgi:uncharacterized protein GlcG (DUF336 family)